MNWLWIYAIITTVVVVLAITTALWLINEFKKKFIIMSQFAFCLPLRMTQWVYPGKNGNIKQGMRNIILQGNKQFSALVGFKLEIFELVGFDYYGFVKSDENGRVVISTYMGKGACTFQFYTSTNMEDNPITVDVSDSVQHFKPDAVFPPHWYQKIGLF